MKKILSMVLTVCMIVSFTFGCFPLSAAAATVDYSDAVLKYVEANTEKGELELGAYWTPQGSSYYYPTGETDSDGNPTYMTDEDGNAIYNEEAYKALLQKYVDAGLNFAVTGNEIYSPSHLDLTVRKAAEVGLDVWFNMCLDNGSTTSVATYTDMWYKYLITAYLGIDYWKSPWKYVEGLTEETWTATYVDSNGATKDVLSSAEKRAYYDQLWEQNKDKINKEALAKLYICDEPAVSASSAQTLYNNYSQLEAKLTEYGITTPAGINFFPITVITDSSGNAIYNYLSKYNKYLDYYLLNKDEIFAGYNGSTNTKINVDWLMFDYYCSQGSSSSLYVTPYFVNAFYFMNYAQQLDVPNYQFVNVVTQNGGGLYSPSENQLLEATHLRLMLGVKGICYFLGWPAYNNSNGEWANAMFDTDGSTTSTYTKVKNVNTKINGMQGVYLTFDNNDGLIEVNGTDVSTSLSAGKSASTYNGASKGDVAKYNKTSTAALSSATGSHAYIGLFTKENSTDEGFYVLNASTSSTSENVLNFSSEKYYQVWGEDGLEAMGKASSLTVSNAAASAKFVIVSDAETELVAAYNNAVSAYDTVSAAFAKINTASYTAASVAEVSAAITKLGTDIAANAKPSVLEADIAAASLDKLVPAGESSDPYEVTIKENVATSLNAIIAYLDTATDTVGNTGKNISALLTEYLAAYEADPSAETLAAITSAWETWSYGGHDASKIFFTDYLLGLVAAFPKQADGSVYLVMGEAKRTPAQLKSHILDVDSSLYVVNKAPSNFGSKLDEMVNGMNAATTASAAKTYLDNLITFMNNNCMLSSAQELYTAIENAKKLAENTSGDADLLAELQEYIEATDEELLSTDAYGFTCYPNAGFVQYRAAGQAVSFTEDVASYNIAFVNLKNDLVECAEAYEATIEVTEDYEVTIKDDVVTAMNAIIAYLDNVSDVVSDGKNIKELLTEKLAAYSADPSADTLAALVSAWDAWSYGGYDAGKVFTTDVLKSLVTAFPKKEDGASAYLVLGSAKKSPKNIFTNYMCSVSDSLYVNNFGPSADYDSGTSDCIKKAGRDAMNKATTASAAYAALQSAIDHINAKCTLISYSDLSAKITEVNALVGTSGDSALYADFIATLDDAKATLAATAPSGITQYRASAQASSFTEDVATADAALKAALSDLTDAAAAYEATVGTGSEPSYEESIKDSVISAGNAIIAYLDNVTAIIKDGKTITQLLTADLAAFEASPSAATLAQFKSDWELWSYTGDDADKVFNTTVFSGLVKAFPVDADGSGISLGSAKKSPKNIVQQYMTKVSDALYVDGKGPSWDYDEGILKTECRNAMNNATTASAALKILTDSIAYLNNTYKLLSYAELETLIAACDEVPTTGGDTALYEDFAYVLGEAKTLLANSAPVGFSQYKPALQGDSFTTDVADTDTALKGMISDLTDAKTAYEETIVTYEQSIKDSVISAGNAIIAYLDNVADIVKDGKTITELLTADLAAFSADPTAETLAAFKADWDLWSYGGYDAGIVFGTDIFKALIKAFPVDANGSGISLGSAKKTPKNIVSWMSTVSDSLYVDGKGPGYDYDLGTAECIKKACRDAMNKNAQTASAAFTILTNSITYLNTNYKLISYADLEALIAEAKLVGDNGDSDLYADFIYVLGEAEKLIAESYPVGFSHYRAAAQSESFTADVADTDASLKNMIADLTEAMDAYKETIVDAPTAEIVFHEDGSITYEINGVPQVAGLVKDDNGNYYFFNSTKKAVKNVWYSFNETYANGLLPAGKYYFGEDGKLQLKNGLVVESNGDVRYYENNVAVVKGLVKDNDGNYYFINGTKKAVKSTWYSFNETYANGLLPAGKYYFGEDGKMQLKNGLVIEANGDIRYYEDNVAVVKGLVQDNEGNYYFINGSKKAVKNTYYAFNDTYSNGLLPAGKYYFGADGKLVLE